MGYPTREWFEKLFGFEEDYQAVYDNIKILNENENQLFSLKNGRTFKIGKFETPSLEELRIRAKDYLGDNKNKEKKINIKHIEVRNIYEIHFKKEYEGALIQVASQFNCLEFASSRTTPESGITQYIYDNTQGPACCLASPAATLFRNYFVNVINKIGLAQRGQTEDNQINNLDKMESLSDKEYWTVSNGYTYSSEAQIEEFNKDVEKDRSVLDKLMANLKIGLQIGADTIDIHSLDNYDNNDNRQSIKVSQAFCSAISISYSGLSSKIWKTLAQLILHATYEATLLAGIINGCKKIVLTFVGGGVFGNDLDWIAEAIGRACALCAFVELDVEIAHYIRVDEQMKSKIDQAYNTYLDENEPKDDIIRTN